MSLNNFIPDHGTTRDISVGNGDLVTIDRSNLAAFPVHIKGMIENLGYSTRFYVHASLNLAHILEACLVNNVKNSSISSYTSSIKRKESLRGNLVYYAAIHVEFQAKEILNVKSSVESDVAIMAILTPESPLPSTGSIVMIAANDVQIYDTWMDMIDDMIRHSKV